jgi:hypothetical protein
MPTDLTRIIAECAALSATIGAIIGYAIKFAEVRIASRHVSGDLSVLTQKTAVNGYASLCKALGERLMVVERQLIETQVQLKTTETERDHLNADLLAIRRRLEAPPSTR